MKKNTNLSLLTLLLLLFLHGYGFAQEGKIKQLRLEHFDLQSSAVIEADGAWLSTENYQAKVYWMPVKVPSTVLSGLVANKVYPDPYIGMNNMLIPDASDEFNKKYDLEKFSHLPNHPNPWKEPYWYRTVFLSLIHI
mgnify:CR=1 FL=1